MGLGLGATCVGVRVTTETREIERQSPFPNCCSPSRKAWVRVRVRARVRVRVRVGVGVRVGALDQPIEELREDRLGK